MYRIPEAPGSCELCGRAVPQLTVHHLIPRSQHRKKAVLKRFTREDCITRILWVCRPCHSMIHRARSEPELAKSGTTRDALMQDPVIREFVEWLKDKPADYMPRVRR